MCTFRRARKQHLSNLKIELYNLLTCLPPLKPGGALLSLSLVYASLPSLPSRHMAPQRTLLVRRPNASILCLLPNIVSPTPHSLYPPFPVVFHCSWTLYFVPEKVDDFLSTLNYGPDGYWTGRHQLTCPINLHCCSCTSALCPFHPIICPRSSSICLEISQLHCMT